MFVIFTATIIIAVGITACGFISKEQGEEGSHSAENTVQTAIPEQKIDKRINFLLLGVDEGDAENPNSPRRSDTMMVASVNTDNKSVNLLSIPRDSKVNIPGHLGYDKITHAYFYGGPELAVRTVEDNFQIPINYYVVIDWKAFIGVVDILGGVDLTVERDMNYEDPYDNLFIHLEKGYQHLGGKQAGEYVRFRHDELGDIGRVQRQEVFLKALTSRMMSTGTILKLPSLITTVRQYVETDVDMYTLIKIANVLKGMHSESVHAEMIPGDFATIDDISYWVPDISETKSIVESKYQVNKLEEDIYAPGY